MVNDYNSLLCNLDKEYPCNEELCGGVVDIVLRDYQYVAYCTDSSDGYCCGFLTSSELLQLSEYFKEVADLVELANFELKYDSLQSKFRKKDGVEND